jgi:predicted amidohydrolase YtcJ
MRIFQGTIKIKGGVIESLIPQSSKLRIILSDLGKEYDLGNSYAIPGLVDSHGHIAALGKKLNGLSLNDCQSAEECAIISSRHETSRGSWIVGIGWNQENWFDSAYPHKGILDEYFPDTPVYLMRVDGHTCWVNSKALKIAGIDGFTPDPAGGSIEKDKSGNPTGILIDNAFLLVKKHIPPNTFEQVESFILDAVNELSANGLTEVHDMDVAPELIPIYKKLNDERKLKIRIQSYITAQNDEYLKHNIQVYESNNFSVRGIKYYADGALGSHGAALLGPYSDRQSSKGLLLIDEGNLYEKARIGVQNGFQIATHAIGDAANRMVLNVYKKLRTEKIVKEKNILRVEHAQIVHPDDQKLFGEYDIIAAVQPIQCISDRFMAPKRLGDRVSYSYPWRSLKKNGALILGGSDFPIESDNPFLGIDAFVNRRHHAEDNSWNDAELLSIDEAFDAYNHDAHKIIMQTQNRGEIKEKMLADICVIDHNPFQNKTDLKSLKPKAVLCNGEIAFMNK